MRHPIAEDARAYLVAALEALGWVDPAVMYSPQRYNSGAPARPFVDVYTISTGPQLQDTMAERVRGGVKAREIQRGVVRVSIYADGALRVADWCRLWLRTAEGAIWLSQSGVTITRIDIGNYIPDQQDTEVLDACFFEMELSAQYVIGNETADITSVEVTQEVIQ